MSQKDDPLNCNGEDEWNDVDDAEGDDAECNDVDKEWIHNKQICAVEMEVDNNVVM